MPYFMRIVFLLIAVSYICADDESCGDNESLNICGRSCEPTCTNRKPNRRMCSGLQCTKFTRACRCNKDFYRNVKTKECVRATNCPTRRSERSPNQNKLICGDNERVGNCGRICERTCTHRNVTSCAYINCSGEGCQCKEGYLRNEETDSCVPVSICPKVRTRRETTKAKKCKAGEVLGACGRRCEGTCESPYTPEICSRIRCSDTDCRCDIAKGYVRNTKTKKCVLTKKCPKAKK